MPFPIIPTRALRAPLLWSVLMAAYSALAVWLVVGKRWEQFARYAELLAGLEAVLSLAIGLLLAFRINRAFERWWEGRTLWGTLVNACRNLAVKINNLVQDHDDEVRHIEELIVAFPYALRDHLRRQPLRLPEGSRVNPPDAGHTCSWIVNQLYGQLGVWKETGRIHYGEFRMLDREAKILLEVCGGCERIRNTPIAYSYRVLLNHLLAFFFLTLPWGIASEIGWATVPLVFLTTYFVTAAEGIADHVEQPFQPQGDGLDLDAICLEIAQTVHEALATSTAAHNTPAD